MITVSPLDASGVLEVQMTAPISSDDYKDVLLPAIDTAIAANDNIRLLVILKAGFSDFTLGAMLDDARLGLKHWSGFDRAAIVTDSTSMKHAMRAFSVFMPCPVDVFEMEQLEDARRWLRESLGTMQQTDLGGGVLHVALRGKLDAQAYETDIDDLNQFFAAHEAPRLLLDLRDFDGWQGLGALRDHFFLVRGHAPKISKAAIVGDAGWQEMAIQVGKRAFGLDAKYFGDGDFEGAKAWVTEA